MVRYQYIIVVFVLFSVLIVAFAITDGRWRRPSYFLGWVSVCVGSFVFLMIFSFVLVNVTARVNWLAPFNQNWRLQLEYDLASLMANYPGPAPKHLRNELEVSPLVLASVAKAEYSPSTNITLRRFDSLLHGVTTSAISRAVDQLAAAEPHELFRHHAEAYAAFLGLEKVCWPIQKRIQPPERGAHDAALVRRVWHLDNFSESIASRTIFQSKWFPANTFLFRPISYIILSIIALAILYVRDAGRRKFLGIVGLPLSAFAYTLSFAPVVPSCDFRYSYWLLVTSTILATIVFFDWFGLRLIAALTRRTHGGYNELVP